MSGQIRMTPAELRDRAKTYGTSARDIEQMLQRLSQTQEQLRSEWEGQAFARFDDQFNQLKPKVTEFANLMDQIEQQLQKNSHCSGRTRSTTFSKLRVLSLIPNTPLMSFS